MGGLWNIDNKTTCRFLADRIIKPLCIRHNINIKIKGP